VDDDRPSLVSPEELVKFLERLERTDVEELEVAHGSARIYLRRAPRRTRGDARSSPEDGASVDGAQSARGVPIVAPLTGVFYTRPTPDQSAYVSEGEWVEVGQVVALIETMKLFNEVTSEVSGEVSLITAKDHDLVEAGQPLVYVVAREE
jgi:acetyl-CoA carboxylase biotin carboxyl carrier protein